MNALLNMPALGVMREAMRFHAARAGVLAENVANVDTPDFTPRDLLGGDAARAISAPSAAAQGPAVGLVATHPMHIAGDPPRPIAWSPEDAPDTETTLDGNRVVLEDQLAKVAETRAGYEAATALYQKALGLLRMAARGP